MVMEVVFRDSYHGLRRVFKDSEPVRRRLWNGLGRYGLVAVAGAMEATVGVGGLATLTGVKTALEYGVVKPFVFYPAKLAARGAIELYHGVAQRAGLGHWYNPNSPWFPRVGPNNIWKYGGLRGRANDPWARPPWMNWWRNPATELPWLRPNHLPRLDPKEPKDEFDRMNIYNSTKPHSLEWHRELNRFYSAEVARETERLLNHYLTVRPPVARPGGGGWDYVDRDGNVVNPPPGGWTGPRDANNNPTPAPHDAGAHLVYNSLDMYHALTNPNQGDRDRAYKAVLDTATWFVQVSHLRQVEEQEWRRGMKIAEDLQRTITRAQALEELLGFNSELRKRSYGFDDAVMGMFTSIVSAF